ncbi:MAG: Imidazole glycerol phosphate synthase, glutamine amidotransferase subunit [uncultured bacterium]|nr:MAG: Imidazole glycerol phosphate synthase, glutamine amidotransferase subunit [uncultured bacterium]
MIVIINTGIGNFKSIQNMLSRIGKKSILSNNAREIENADKLILPGVGSFDKGMQALQDYHLVDVIKDMAKSQNVKLLGICLGMQMLAESSEEGALPGLGIIKGNVRRFADNFFKIPHMGWNYVIPTEESILFRGYDSVPRFYFTHSYWFDCDDYANILAKTSYEHDFVSAIRSGNNIYGVQFHPEKSHRFGFQLLKNFASC